MTTKCLPEEVRQFFAWSERLDYLVLRPLSHITSSWETTWSHEEQRYEPEEGTFAQALNDLIEQMATTASPKRYHDNEDRLAEFVIERLGWKISKVGQRWVGNDYASILEQGGFGDLSQKDLVQAATGRVHAALARRQMHFDEMEESHRKMLADVMAITIYHRYCDGTAVVD